MKRSGVGRGMRLGHNVISTFYAMVVEEFVIVTIVRFAPFFFPTYTVKIRVSTERWGRISFLNYVFLKAISSLLF
jgi:hypothetical protein